MLSKHTTPYFPISEHLSQLSSLAQVSSRLASELLSGLKTAQMSNMGNVDPLEEAHEKEFAPTRRQRRNGQATLSR
ncbi:hypothetical protein [Deinococcus sp.]|uniref:hypothetical protein n=1 Tax=Deinococcus sp. TaxID=47478 RepID=UPI003B59B3DE